ncbi:MAG: hypothetical protein AAGJ87_17485, partial [Pseudomonadota bacterium]
DDRLLSPQSFAVMRTRHFRDQPRAPGFAHGFMEAEVAGFNTFGHGGTLTGFISNMTIAPELGIGVFVAANAAERPRLPDAISDFVIEYFAGVAREAPHGRSSASDAQIAAAKDVAGLYQPNRRVHSKLEKINATSAEMTITARDDGSIVVTSGGSTKRYYPSEDDLWTDYGRNRIAAYRNEAGAIVRVATSAGTNSYEKIGFLQSAASLNLGLGAATLFAATMLLGAWRRQGRQDYLSPSDRYLFIAPFASSIAWFGVVVAIGWATASLANMDFAAQAKLGWPPSEIAYISIAANIAAALAVLTAATFPFVWTAEGWSVWRKIHFSLFVAAGLFAVYALWTWRLILAPVTTA